jgi:hypothetical protein
MTCKGVTLIFLYLKGVTCLFLTRDTQNNSTSSRHSTRKRPRNETTLMTSKVHETQHSAHQESTLHHSVLHTQLFKDCVSIKVGLDNYKGLIDYRERI